MNWQITEQGALFAIFIPAFAWSGYRRGWKRETVSLLFIVLGLVFLLLNGGAYLAKLLYQYLLDTNLTENQVITSHPKSVLIITDIAFGIIVLLGYFIGRRAFPKSPAPQERVWGIFPGAVTGAVVAAFVTYYLFPNTQTTVISAGTIFLNIIPNLIANFTVVVIFLLALVVVFIGLAALRFKRGGTKAGGGGGGHVHTTIP